ncbi:MAG: S8 family serine peptidase [Rhodospirillaceae bacterium]|nr:S8 family serine peptidase [Rhodospirillaceae bacterium]
MLAWTGTANAQTNDAERDTPAWLAPLQAKLGTSERLDVLIEVALPLEPTAPVRERSEPQASAESVAETTRTNVAAMVVPLAETLRGEDVPVHRTYDYQPLIHASLSLADLRRLAARTDILTVHENIRYQLPTPPSSLERESGTNAPPERESPQLTSSVIAMGAASAWSRGFRGQGYAIAIVDTGLNAKHEMFRGKITAEACFSDPGTYSYYQSFCPEKAKSATGPGAATLCPDMRLRGETVCDHGSHVAGIAAGSGGAKQGVAPSARLVPIQVFSGAPGCSYCLGAYTSDLVAAVDWLIKNGPTHNVAAVNMSLGGSSYSDYCTGQAMERGIRTLRAMGILTAIAAGNSGYVGRVGHPGCIKDAVTVGSTNNAGVHSYYSNSAPMVDIAAPGERISSAIGGGETSYDTYSGTSMATPHVAGAVAVLRSRLPRATPEEIEYALKYSGPKLRDSGWAWSIARLDLASAIDIVGTPPPPPGVPMAGLFPGTRPGPRSILRLANPSHTEMKAWLILMQDSPRRVLGGYLAIVPGRSTQQFAMSDMENALGQRADPSATVTVYVDVPGRAFAQHVAVDPAGQAMSNLTVCTSERADLRTYLPYVHAATSSELPSYIVLMNSSAVRRAATFDVYNAATGASLGTAVTPLIEANSSVVMSARAIITAAPLGGTPGLVAVNLELRPSFDGIAGHAVEQTRWGALTDMSVKCAI